jgi:hypothetical protein
MIHNGSCNCGRIAFEVEGDVPQVMECNCSYCSRKGYLLRFVSKQQLKLDTSEANLSTYTFNAAFVVALHLASARTPMVKKLQP